MSDYVQFLIRLLPIEFSDWNFRNEDYSLNTGLSIHVSLIPLFLNLVFILQCLILFTKKLLLCITYFFMMYIILYFLVYFSYRNKVDEKSANWEDVDNNIPSCLSKLILDHFKKQDIGVDLRKNFRTGAVQMKGLAAKKAIVRREIEKYLASKRVDYSYLPEETPVHTFQRKDEKIFYEIKEHEELLEIDYKINLRIDTGSRQIFAKGETKDVDRFFAYIKIKLFSSTHAKGVKKTYMMGLEYDAELEFHYDSRFRNLTRVTRCPPTKIMNSCYEIAGLRKRFYQIIGRDQRNYERRTMVKYL